MESTQTRKRASTVKHVVCPVTELPPGSRRIVEVGGRSIGVFNIGGKLLAVRNRCPHQGAPLCLGHVQGYWTSTRPHERILDESRPILKCPWHGWEFDLETGRSVAGPDRWRVRTYPTEVERVQVETFDVTTEEAQVILLVTT